MVRDGAIVTVGMGLRSSSPEMAAAVRDALSLLGYRPEFLKALPTPALALRCVSSRVLGVMVTEGHVPFD